MSLSAKALAAFASKATAVVENVFTNSQRMGKLFQEGQAHAVEEANKAIKGELGSIATAMNDRKLALAQTAAAYRRQATLADEAGAAVDLAFKYGEVTDNYLPLLSVLGIVTESDYAPAGLSHADWKELCTIPEGWTAPEVSGS